MNDTFYEDDFLYIFNGCCAKENKTDDTNFQHSVTAESYNSFDVVQLKHKYMV